MPSTSSVSPTHDQDINGLLVGTKWAVNALTYGFPNDTDGYGSFYGSGEPRNGFAPLTGAQQNATVAILGMYASVANLTFTFYGGSSAGLADLRYARSNAPSTAWAYYPHPAQEGGDSWYNTSSGWYDNPVRGNYAWHTFIHETGHALGLKHGQDGSGFGAMTHAHDSMEFSVMTYRAYVGDAGTGYPNETWGFAQTPMIYDIAALQHMYGANYNSNAGDTSYMWNPSTGEFYIDGVGRGAPGGNRILMTVWDGGGTDTYNLSNYATDLTIRLQPGDWTITSMAQLARLHFNGSQIARGNIANALLFNGDPRSLIENAIGGSGSDNITGNDAANLLQGGGGNDRLSSLAGNDRLQGGPGDDWLDGGSDVDSALYGGAHTDYQFVQQPSGWIEVDDLRFGAPDGVDMITGIEYFEFADGVYWLHQLAVSPPEGGVVRIGGGGPDSFVGGSGPDQLLGGGGNDFLDGRGGDDRLFGEDSDDQLFGGAGSDHLDGGPGNDRLFGGSGSDSLLGGGGTDHLDAEDGDDRIYGSEGSESLLGGAGHDRIEGGGGDDRLYGGDGSDGLIGEEGHDRLEGEAGNDVLQGGNGDDGLIGGEGDDILEGGDGNDVLLGSGGTDFLTGGAGDDLLDGGANPDGFIFAPGFGRDMITGFEGGPGFVDNIRLDPRLFGGGPANFDAVLARAADDGAGNVIITFDAATQLSIVGITKAQLAPDDFSFA